MSRRAPGAAGSACRLLRTSKIGRNCGSSSGTPLALVAICTALAPFFKARSASLAAASGAFIGSSADQPTKWFGCFAREFGQAVVGDLRHLRRFLRAPTAARSAAGRARAPAHSRRTSRRRAAAGRDRTAPECRARACRDPGSRPAFEQRLVIALREEMIEGVDIAHAYSFLTPSLLWEAGVGSRGVVRR